MSNRANSSLTTLFKEFNDQFFNNRLPKYRVVYANAALGGKYGECIQSRLLIRISSHLKDTPDELRQYLLHEMCHHGCPNHGKRFIKKLEHLAAMGEDWAVEEIEIYQDGPSWNEEMHLLRQDLNDLVAELCSADKSLSYSYAVATASRRLGLTKQEIRRKIPWLRAAWKEAVADAKMHRE